MRRFKDFTLKLLIYLSVILTVGCIFSIVIFMFVNGISKLNIQFILGDIHNHFEGGVIPMIVTTIYTVVISLLIATPIGIFSAIYLQEYAKQGIFIEIIRFSIEALAGIPSIVYGLFGGVFFVSALKFGYSIIACSFTLAIIILPVIIRTTEETLHTVPQSYKEGALALGSTKFQTLMKVVLPYCISGILSGIILSVGRIVGESAPVLLTLGTVAKMPSGIFSSARTLTVHSYLLTKETGDIQSASAIGIVLLVIVFFLNLLTRFIGKKLNRS
ncbi:MAG: phosphate ABC transporter permease PstA [Clostridioides sp.]|jgi:phosphate transport system permease protein|nr:phosphate ABC transporter permease PstA [Clostridioides sp.]